MINSIRLLIAEILLDITLSIMPDSEEKLELAEFLYKYAKQRLEKRPWQKME
jgi:hypothetical protein